MERATKRDGVGYYLTGDGIYSDWGAPECFRGEDVDRFAAYEDTGLEPTEIVKILADIEHGFLKSAARRYGIPIDRIRALAQADREERCVVLPCNVGATVYLITTQSDDFSGERLVAIQTQFSVSLLQDIGKTVFLTRAEAEDALRSTQQ